MRLPMMVLMVLIIFPSEGAWQLPAVANLSSDWDSNRASPSSSSSFVIIIILIIITVCVATASLGVCMEPEAPLAWNLGFFEPVAFGGCWITLKMLCCFQGWWITLKMLCCFQGCWVTLKMLVLLDLPRNSKVSFGAGPRAHVVSFAKLCKRSSCGAFQGKVPKGA
jgi:hypothetical protein